MDFLTVLAPNIIIIYISTFQNSIVPESWKNGIIVSHLQAKEKQNWSKHYRPIPFLSSILMLLNLDAVGDRTEHLVPLVKSSITGKCHSIDCDGWCSIWQLPHSLPIQDCTRQTIFHRVWSYALQSAACQQCQHREDSWYLCKSQVQGAENVYNYEHWFQLRTHGIIV